MKKIYFKNGQTGKCGTFPTVEAAAQAFKLSKDTIYRVLREGHNFYFAAWVEEEFDGGLQDAVDQLAAEKGEKSAAHNKHVKQLLTKAFINSLDADGVNYEVYERGGYANVKVYTEEGYYTVKVSFSVSR